MFNIIIKGAIAGFSLAAPGEAIGFLCIKETDRDTIIGITTGCAAASADFLYGILAIIVFHLCHSLLTGHQTTLNLIAGLFLCAFGLKRFFNTPTLDKVKLINGKLTKIFIKTFLFTLTNSSTILEFFALFIGFDIEFSKYHELFLFVMGVFFGSLIWWISLSITDKFFKKKLSLKILRYLNYTSGIIIFSFGLYTLSQLFST